MNHGDNDAKQRLLLTAKRLFAKQGFEATSVRQICEEAGVNIALVSYHFGGKDGLFRAIYEHYFRRSRYEPIESLKGEPVKALQAFIDALIVYRFEEPELIAITTQEITMASKRSKQLEAFIRPAWRLLKNILQEGQRSGVFHIESADYAMLGIMGMLLFPPTKTIIEPLLDAPLNREELTRYIKISVFRSLGITEARME